MKSSRLVLAALLAGIGLGAAAEMPRLEFTAGMYRIDAEVASDQQTRMQGLMYRRSMPQHQGMMFVFPVAAQHCMWMKNTFMPLSVAFLDREGRILNIEEMKPQTENNHCAAKPAFFALEMNSGWFASRGIKPGMSIGGIQRVPEPR